MGLSAGGHLAATAATHFDSPATRPDFAILAYPVISFTTPYTHKGSLRNLLGENPEPGLVQSLSNELQVTPQTPPTFLFHTNEDQGVPPENSVLFYNALRKAGVPAEMHIFERGPHGVGLAPTYQALAPWPQLLANWMRSRGLLAPASQASERPKILGVAHIALFVSDIEKARAFYKDFLGFEEPFYLNKPDGSVDLTFIKINDHQYIELFNGLKSPQQDRLNHISIYVDDAERMRRYLGARGVKVPDSVPKGRTRNSNFNVKDPDGHTVEIVQYEPDGWPMKFRGRMMPDSRISARMMHVGIIVRNLDAAMKFYGDLLGFREIWRGSSNGQTLSWVNMQVPEGRDYIEFMLYKDPPPGDRRGSAHHIALEVPDMVKAQAALEGRQYRKGYQRPLEPRTGTNRKRQLNLFDPDGTRTELMEPNTVDGVPAPPSAAPPPQ